MKNKQAFTLIELLVVVLIIGILAAVAVPKYQLAVAKSRFTEALLLTYDLKKQQELFFLANGYYAANCEELSPELPAGGFITDNKVYIGFTNDENKFLTCSNGHGTRVGMSTGANANLELWLDHVEHTDKGWCRAITDIGHKFCAQMGKTKQGDESFRYYF